MPRYPCNTSYFEYRLCHNFSGEIRAWIKEISCTNNNYFLCDRVCTQSKKLKENILVAFWSGKLWAGKWCITFWVKMRKHREIYLHSIRMSVQCIRTSVQCIQAKTTWLPTLKLLTTSKKVKILMMNRLIRIYTVFTDMDLSSEVTQLDL